MRIALLALLVAVICCAGAPDVFAQAGNLADLGAIPKLGEVRGIASFRGSDKLFLAVWYYNLRQNQIPSDETFLVIYEMQQEKAKEVFRLTGDVEDIWQELMPSGTFGLTGLIIQSSHSFTDYDAAIVIALVGSKFQVVFKGLTSEFVDLNSDGTPEILESMWPDGDGYPETTTIHVWDGRIYEAVVKTMWRERFGRVARAAVVRASRRFKSRARN